jgi:tRNA pseudouridine55 synthase
VPGKQLATDRPAPWESGLVIVDKPGGMTSHDVVARIRRLAHTRRVGHAGTLDPMATGVLVIGVEKATRLLGHLMLTEKTYQATIRLGQSTTTDDAEGEPLPARGDAPPEPPGCASDERKGSVSGARVVRAADVSRESLDAEVAKLTGEIMQVPSSVSAIKVNGERAYKLTRAGEAPELAARPVTVYDFSVTAVRQAGDYLDLDATVRCSSGTYIRALARDLGTALGTGGHLTALRRTAVGPYDIARAHTLKDLESQDQDPNESSERSRLTPAPQAASHAPPSAPDAGPIPDGAVVPWVIPLADAAAAAFPRLNLTADEARRLAQGARLPCPPGQQFPPEPRLPAEAAVVLDRPDVPLAAFDPDGTLIALVTEEGGRLRSLAVFVDAAAKTWDT